ncbi:MULTISPECIES: deoxyribodipyrimidine photo-lyase [unclassified Duganella]|uniref:cryptochrome/photolyase family protein n=1 Tax=unclassified Duganella TaxID=2636909 RepID=UPI000E347378|nr:MULTISPECIES: deoxyribodipyrimidine photo-lyase [unclassified Duganella]RFP12021.1 deoxyribodipyrimidine photo-lyase [Duganella sp. BJB475]RFP29968.1 deoxyribodipyrimidine photo-lyase [Duganella sp. BJB476]
MKLNSSLVWLRRDLRVFDHVALHQALQDCERVYCVFVYDTTILAGLPRRDRRVDFIHASIAEVAAELQQLGGHLIVRHADPAAAIPALAAELGVDAVYCNHDYEPQAIARDAAVAQALRADGRQFFSYKDQVIFEKSEVLSQTGGVFSVFTPYKNAWLKKLEADPSVLAPYHIEPHAARLAQPPARVQPPPTLAELGFEPSNLAEMKIPTGMSGAAQLWEDFLPRIASYKDGRDYPAVKGPSYLSIHFRFGTLSVRHLVRTVVDLMARGTGGEGAPVWLAELIWREFYAMILFHNPHVVGGAYKPAYDAIQWETGSQADELFAAWCEGRTGYPLVDAAMAQLNQTGYMHNRLRMVTACFLIKDLGIDWRRGEAYFALHLNDFDLASNNGGWQWASSSGCDAQPYFRIFNPITQSEKFDSTGKFIRRYLPQLKDLSDKEIHAPWLVPRMLPLDYPGPIVMHDEARKRTLERYVVVKKPD